MARALFLVETTYAPNGPWQRVDKGHRAPRSAGLVAQDYYWRKMRFEVYVRVRRHGSSKALFVLEPQRRGRLGQPPSFVSTA